MKTDRIIIVLPIINYIIFISISKFLGITWYASVGYAVTTTLFEILVFRKWLWKVKFIQKITNVKNIQGTWKGKIISNYDNKEHIVEEVIIKQSFNKYIVIMGTKESKSSSNITDLKINEFGRMELHYMYKNEAPANLRKKNPMHFGVANLEFKDNKLIGIYWTDREIEDGKNTRGTIELEKTNKKGNYDLVNLCEIFDLF